MDAARRERCLRPSASAARRRCCTRRRSRSRCARRVRTTSCSRSAPRSCGSALATGEVVHARRASSRRVAARGRVACRRRVRRASRGRGRQRAARRVASSASISRRTPRRSSTRRGRARRSITSSRTITVRSVSSDARGDRQLVAIVHVTPDAGRAHRDRATRHAHRWRHPDRRSVGKLRAGFVGEVTSCVELVKRIASEAPRRLELLCAPSSPGELWSSACIGHTLPSVTALVAPNGGSLGQLADMFTALPALERAFVVRRARARAVRARGAARAPLRIRDRCRRRSRRRSRARSFAALERCALTFKRISTASLLKLVEALAMRQRAGVAHGPLRWPARPGSDPRRHELLSERRAAVRVGARLVQRCARRRGAVARRRRVDQAAGRRCGSHCRSSTCSAPSSRQAQLRRHRWLVDVAEIGWAPGDVRAAASW